MDQELLQFPTCHWNATNQTKLTSKWVASIDVPYGNLTKSSLSHPLPLFQCQITMATLFQEVTPESAAGADPNGTLIPKQDFSPKQ